MADSTNASKMALASLRKRGINLSEHELHIAVLYGMVRSTCYNYVSGDIEVAEAVNRIDDAVDKFRELENPDHSEVVVL